MKDNETYITKGPGRIWQFVRQESVHTKLVDYQVVVPKSWMVEIDKMGMKVGSRYQSI